MRIRLDKRVAKRCHIYTMLKRRGKHLSFHTPGHKTGKWDITELSYSDNLRSPKGCILAAERDIAGILGAKRSFLLTDGSTSGVHAMLYAAKRAGVEKIATLDDAHESFFHGCEILGLIPLVGEEFFEEADALFITSPTYYGKVAELAALRAYCDEKNKLLLIDGAHGGHLHFDRNIYAGSYADAWVDGVHKSLPALTQGAVVSTASEGLIELLQAGVEIFRTTSPSYPIMASVEYAARYPRNEKLENAVRAFAENCPWAELKEDWTKLCISFGKHAFAAQAELEKRGIYPEFCDGDIVMFYLSPATKTREFKKLQKELARLLAKYPLEQEKSVQRNPAPLVLQANGKKVWVDLEKSEGRICAQNCGLFPPCTPLLRVGERIAKEKIEKLRLAPNTYGLRENKIVVYEEENDEKR